MNKTKARELRKNPTEAEHVLWQRLRLRQLGGYIAVCGCMQLIYSGFHLHEELRLQFRPMFIRFLSIHSSENRCKFRRQQPLGQYIVDFVCLEERLVIEVDGGQHSEQIMYDAERSACLEDQGFRVLRFWDTEVLRDIEAVKEVIWEALGRGFDTPHLNPPPQGGRRRE